MVHSNDPDQRAQAQEGVDVAADRRRPGRPKQVSAALVKLLRGEFDQEAPPDPVLRRAGAFDLEFALGAAVALGFFSVGVALRFIA